MTDLPALGPVHRPEPPDTVSGRIRSMAAWALCIAFFYLIPLEWASLEWEWTEKGLWRITEDGEESVLLAGFTLLWALFNLAAALAFLITGVWTHFAHERKGWIRSFPLRDVVYYFAWVECLITAVALLAEFVPEDVRGFVHQHLLPVAPHAVMILAFLFLFRGGFDRYGFRGASPGGWVLMVATVGGLYGLVYLFLDPLVTEPVARYFSLELVSWREESISREIGEAGQSGWLALLSQGLLVGMIGPVGEEVMFRGVLQQSLAERIGQPASVLLTSLLFALFHVDVVMFAPLLVLGLILGILRAVFRNLWAPILFHVVNNSVSVILDLLS
ncbi:MAG: CPBP family intramembrane glutamic endopeptidase [Planifilum fimeticola]